jgi:hypothetical protein
MFHVIFVSVGLPAIKNGAFLFNNKNACYRLDE